MSVEEKLGEVLLCRVASGRDVEWEYCGVVSTESLFSTPFWYKRRGCHRITPSWRMRRKRRWTRRSRWKSSQAVMGDELSQIRASAVLGRLLPPPSPPTAYYADGWPRLAVAHDLIARVAPSALDRDHHPCSPRSGRISPLHLPRWLPPAPEDVRLLAATPPRLGFCAGQGPWAHPRKQIQGRQPAGGAPKGSRADETA
jgi:hypothetical protein